MPSKAALVQHRIARQFSPEVLNYCENMLVALSLTQAGYGISILPQNIRPSQDIAYIPLNDTESISYGVFYKDLPNDRLTKSFLATVRECQPEFC